MSDLANCEKRIYNFLTWLKKLYTLLLSLCRYKDAFKAFLKCAIHKVTPFVLGILAIFSDAAETSIALKLTKRLTYNCIIHVSLNICSQYNTCLSKYGKT